MNWLRALGLVDSVARKYYATEAGLKLVADVKRSGEADPDKQRAISHSDIEEKLVVIGEFFEFEATKRPSINTVLPSYLSNSLRVTDNSTASGCASFISAGR